MTFSLSISHTPWHPERVEALAHMRRRLEPTPGRFFIHDADYRGQPWAEVKHEWALAAWRWHLDAGESHCILMSDDLHIAPGFWDIMHAMVAEVPDQAIGCMSNHPKAPGLLAKGVHWYRTRAWLVGPCILMPRDLLSRFVRWYEAWYPGLPRGRDTEGFQEFYHDDSSINEWLSQTGRDAYHPIPAPIEHRLEIGRSGNLQPFPEYAKESVSWRSLQEVSQFMAQPEWWRTEKPFLHVPSEEKRLGLE